MGLSRKKFDYVIETITEDIDFVASTEEVATISIVDNLAEVLRGRLYIDVDPGAAFSAWATYTFYNKAAMRGEDAFYRTAAKLVYTELDLATVIGSPNIKPDSYIDFNPNDLATILDTTNENARIKTVASTMIAEDNLLAVHAIGQGVVRVSEFSGVTLYNKESGTNVYLRISFAAAQTVSLKLEMDIKRKLSG